MGSPEPLGPFGADSQPVLEAPWAPMASLGTPFLFALCLCDLAAPWAQDL